MIYSRTSQTAFRGIPGFRKGVIRGLQETKMRNGGRVLLSGLRFYARIKIRVATLEHRTANQQLVLTAREFLPTYSDDIMLQPEIHGMTSPTPTVYHTNFSDQKTEQAKATYVYT